MITKVFSFSNTVKHSFIAIYMLLLWKQNKYFKYLKINWVYAKLIMNFGVILLIERMGLNSPVYFSCSIILIILRQPYIPIYNYLLNWLWYQTSDNNYQLNSEKMRFFKTNNIILSGSNNDIKMILFQIMLMQSFFYLSLCLIVSSLTWLSGLYTHSGQIFSREIFSLSYSNGYTWIAFISYAIEMPLLIIWTAAIVERSMKVLDYLLTVLLYHFLLCWIMYGLPYYPSWIITNGVFFTWVILAAEQTWLKLEMQEIKLNVGNKIKD